MRRFRRWLHGNLKVIAACAVTATVTTGAFPIISSAVETSRPPQTLAAPNSTTCVHYEVLREVKVGEPSQIRAVAKYLECDDGRETTRGITPGDKSRLRLASPLFPGKIEPVTPDARYISDLEQTDTWIWDIMPGKPGAFQLTFFLDMQTPQDTPIAIQQDEAVVSIQLYAAGTPSYYASVAWSGITEFATSLQGLVFAIVGAIYAISELFSRQHRRKQQSEIGGNQQDDSG